MWHDYDSKVKKVFFPIPSLTTLYSKRLTFHLVTS